MKTHRDRDVIPVEAFMAINREVAGTVNIGTSVQDPSLKRIEAYEKRKALEAEAYTLWEQVCTSVKKRCSELNEEYGKEVATTQTTAAGEMSTRLNVAGTESKLNATFDAASVACALKWFYSGPAARSSPDGRCRIYVHHGAVAFQANATPYTADAIAKKMFDGLLSE
jgi:hypothetical protein